MGKQFFDYTNGELCHAVSDNLAIDMDGNMMLRMSDNMAIDMNSGDLRMISSWSMEENSEDE